MLKHSHYIPKQVYHQCLNSQSHGKIEYICLIPIVKMWAPLPYFLDVRIGVTWITYARSNWHVIRAFIREATPKNDKINYLMPTWAKAYLFCKLEIWPYYFIRFSSEPLPKTWVFFFLKCISCPPPSKLKGRIGTFLEIYPLIECSPCTLKAYQIV